MMLPLSSLILILLLDGIFFNALHFYNIIIKKDCEYKIPDDWEILYTKNTYVIKNIPNNEYLYIGWGLQLMSPTKANPLEFYDSCTAKGGLKWYIHNNRDRSKNFIPIK